MAVHPEGNPGIAPLDANTEVGQFRLLFGDTQYSEYTPVVTGIGNYETFSDAEIQAFLAQSPGNMLRSVGFAYMQLAGAAAHVAKSVKDYDLSVDLTKRPAEYRALAQFWFDRADEADDAAGGSDFFDVFDLGTDALEIIPEAMIPEYGRYYVRGRIDK